MLLLQTCLPKGEYCDIISGSVTSTGCSGKIIKVTEGGEAEIIISKFDPNNLADDGVLAIHINAVKGKVVAEKNINLEINK